MPKSSSFAFAVGSDQNVRRFDVAMDDELPVSELHRCADIAEQRDAFFDAQLALRGVAQQRFAVDIFHREIRTSIVGDAAVEQARDVRMFETRENLALAQEARLHRVGIHAALDDFQRGALFELSVGAFGEQHDAHAAAAEFAQHAPRTDTCLRRFALVVARPCHRRFAARGIDAVVETSAAAIGGEKLFDFVPHADVIARKVRRATSLAAAAGASATRSKIALTRCQRAASIDYS